MYKQLLLCYLVYPLFLLRLIFLKKCKIGYEILFVKRSDSSSSFKRAHVFPGGMVEAIADDTQNWNNVFPSSIPLFKYKIAAIREAFEETGILYCDCKDSSYQNKHFDNLREKVHENALLFPEICRQLGQAPKITNLIHFSHWLTPTRYAKRFETHFFLAVLESHHSDVATSDFVETVEAVWMNPIYALKQYDLGNIVLFPPQWYMVQEMVKHSNLDEFIAYTKQKVNVPMLPEFIKDEFGQHLSVLPGDREHSTFTDTGPLFAPYTKHRLSYQLDEVGNIRKIQFCPDSYQISTHHVPKL